MYCLDPELQVVKIMFGSRKTYFGPDRLSFTLSAFLSGRQMEFGFK